MLSIAAIVLDCCVKLIGNLSSDSQLETELPNQEGTRSKTSNEVPQAHRYDEWEPHGSVPGPVFFLFLHKWLSKQPPPLWCGSACGWRKNFADKYCQFDFQRLQYNIDYSSNWSQGGPLCYSIHINGSHLGWIRGRCGAVMLSIKPKESLLGLA